MRIPAPNFTATPNDLFDEWLPLLSHVELKVLMTIMRKTFGWHKIRDRISLSQLEKITGSKRSAIIKAAKNLQKMGLIFKEVVGEKGFENTVYELVVIEDSNNFTQSPGETPPSLPRRPTKETFQNVSKETYKETSKGKKKEKIDLSPKITFNSSTRKFEGITQEDIDTWRKAHPSVNVNKVIDECAIWALSNPREHYRKSINTYMKNTEKNHTTPYIPKDKNEVEFSLEDVKTNKSLAEKWELEYSKKRMQNYDIHAKPSNVLFLFPNNVSESLEFNHPTEEFKKKCQQYLNRLKIQL